MRHTPLAIQLQIDGEFPDLSDEQTTAVFRVVQETLSNTVRHAHARTASIRVIREGPYVSLSVIDDGRGFDVSIHKANSFGLVGMRERALMLGGDLSITSEPGHTQLWMKFPIRNDTLQKKART